MNDTRPDLKIPTIHLNGSNGQTLFDAVARARERAQELLDALHEAAPNGRDYYVQGPHATGEAQNQHTRRLAHVEGVLDDLTEILMGISDQLTERKR